MEQFKKVSLHDFLAEQEIRFECQHKDIYYRCRYKINGHWLWAKICFQTKTILVSNGQVVKGGIRI